MTRITNPGRTYEYLNFGTLKYFLEKSRWRTMENNSRIKDCHLCYIFIYLFAEEAELFVYFCPTNASRLFRYKSSRQFWWYHSGWKDLWKTPPVSPWRNEKWFFLLFAKLLSFKMSVHMWRPKSFFFNFNRRPSSFWLSISSLFF